MIKFSIKHFIAISLLCSSITLLPSGGKLPHKDIDKQKEKETDTKQAKELAEASDPNEEISAADKATLLTLAPVLDHLERALRPLRRFHSYKQEEYLALKKEFLRQCNLADSICQRFSEPFKQKIDGAFQALLNGINLAKQEADQLDAQRKRILLKELSENHVHANQAAQAIALSINDIPEDDHPQLQYNPAAQKAAPDEFSRALVQGGEQGRMLLEQFEKNVHEMNKQDHEGWTPAIQLAAHGHTQLLQDSLKLMVARWYSAQNIAYADLNAKGDAEILTVITFDAPAKKLQSDEPTTKTIQVTTKSRALTAAHPSAATQHPHLENHKAYEDAEFEFFDNAQDQLKPQIDITGTTVADTANAGSAGSAGAGATAAALKTMVQHTVKKPDSKTKESAAAPKRNSEPSEVIVDNAALRTRHYFVNSKKFRPILCRTIMLPKPEAEKVVAKLKTERPTAVLLTGPEAYFFTKHLAVRARTYPNISVIDDHETKQQFQKEHTEYQTKLQAAVHQALDLPQEQQPMPLEAFFALETPAIAGIPVKTVRDLIGSFLVTDFPHDIKFSLPQAELPKRKDGNCTIQ